MGKRDPFPLQWPERWNRTAAHRRSRPKFVAQFARDHDSVLRQLRRRGSQIVITSDLPTRNDGLPYANATCSDPGVAVWWVEDGHEHVLACDRWHRIQENLRAIDMSLEALRGLDRWGASEMVERAFAGFAALPPGATPAAPPPRTWREVLEVEGAWTLAAPPAALLAFAKQQHRRMIVEHHSDKGGDPLVAAEINAALAAAELEIGGG